MTANALATVTIVNFNGAHLLAACLDALDAQRQPETSFDTIVVDNNSADDSLSLLANKYPWVRVIASPVNLGFAGGNNLALKEITTPYAVLLNNDATPEPGWLSNLLGTFGEIGNEDVGIVTGKIVFMPTFARMRLETRSFSPGTGDTRELGVRIYEVKVNGADVTDKVLWGQLGYGPEGTGEGRFRWTRPSGDFLLPVGRQLSESPDPVVVTVRAAAESSKPLRLFSNGTSVETQVGSTVSSVAITLDPDAGFVDVINNAGGIVLRDGSGADRGFQEIDEGQYDEPAEVFTACGNGMAMRTAIGRELGWFDDGFFMYYEDTDLSWRWRSRGWSIRYTPTARLRHIHAASSKEWSPRWLFHVERNRLLMLTKNASWQLASRAVLRYLMSSAASLARDSRHAVSQRRRPPLRRHLLRARIALSYLRLLPGALRARRRIGARATVSRMELQQHLVATR